MVVTGIVEGLAERGHRIEVITTFPWYREHAIEPGYAGKVMRKEDTPWGRVTRLHPFPSPDKRQIVRRGLSFVGFSALATLVGRRREKADAVLAVSPPLTLGVAGARIARARRAAYVLNIQDVFPDVVIELGMLTNQRLIGAARMLEKDCYRRADAITVLSEDLKDNVAAKLGSSEKVHVIPNFVDTDRIVPGDRENRYREEFGLADKRVVMYAGNVGLSQSLELVLDAASALTHEPDVVFVINGAGARRAELERMARGMSNVRFVDLQPQERLPEVLGAADMHVVALKKGLGRSSVPSKAYSILAAGRPVVASVDEGSSVARLIADAGAGIVVPPEDPESFTKAVRRLLDDPDEASAMGLSGRRFVERWASPSSVAEAYEDLFATLVANRASR